MPTTIPERYRSVGALSCAAAYVDGDGGILAANEAFQSLRMQAGAVAPIDGDRLPLLFVPDDRERVRDILASPSEHARRASRATRVTGSLAPMLAEFVPIRRKTHTSVRWLVTLRPSQQVQEPTGDLASRAAVTAGIVHDLKAPVQVVLGWASLLRRKRDEPERIEQALTIIERNAALLIDLLEDLLEQTRPPWTRTPERRKRVDLVELLRAEVRSIQPLADEAGLRVGVVLDAPAVLVEGNEVDLRRIVSNLIGNALKFTPKGGTIECRLWRSLAWAGIVVRDTGRGIDREYLPKVFDAFWQAPGQSLQAGTGFGLGLQVVRHLVERHGGTVTAASEGTGRGATFTVLLPLAAAAEELHEPDVPRASGEFRAI